MPGSEGSMWAKRGGKDPEPGQGEKGAYRSAAPTAFGRIIATMLSDLSRMDRSLRDGYDPVRWRPRICVGVSALFPLRKKVDEKGIEGSPSPESVKTLVRNQYVLVEMRFLSSIRRESHLFSRGWGTVCWDHLLVFLKRSCK